MKEMLELTVITPVSTVDRGKFDARNILGIVTEKTDEKIYQIDTRDGAIDLLYNRAQFTV